MFYFLLLFLLIKADKIDIDEVAEVGAIEATKYYHTAADKSTRMTPTCLGLRISLETYYLTCLRIDFQEIIEILLGSSSENIDRSSIMVRSMTPSLHFLSF